MSSCPRRSLFRPAHGEGTKNRAVLMTFCMVLSFIAGAIVLVEGRSDLDGDRQGTRSAPSGYSTLDDLVSRYPSYISGTGPVYTVSRTLELGPSVPLYVSAGQSILFDEGVYLNLSGPPIFDGSMTAPVTMGPAPGAGLWGGLVLLESDPETPSVLKNVTVDRAQIGIRSAGSDLHLENARIGNCSRSGLEITKVSSPAARADVKDTSISNCTYYGAQLSDVREVSFERVTTLGCGTGIRLYRTDAVVRELFLLNSSGMGLSLVGSKVRAYGLWATSGSSTGVSTTYQLIAHSSEVTVLGGSLGRSKVCAIAISGSDMVLKDMEIGPAFTDGVQSNDSSLTISGGSISSCRESAVHSEGPSLFMTGTNLENNGKGSGTYRYSSLYLRSSTVRASGLTIKGSGDAHVQCIDTDMMLENSSLGHTAFASLKLDLGSRLDVIGTKVPGRMVFADAGSRVRTIDLFVVEVREFTSGTPVGGATVDVLGPGKGYIGSHTTSSPSGRTPLISAVTSVNTSAGNITGLPLDLVASKTGYELTVLEVQTLSDLVTMELYPPNEPPTLSLLRPLNGTRAGPHLVIEGYIGDDLEIFKVQVRVGSGPWSTHSVTPEGQSGYFIINITLPGTAPGQQTLMLQAFDGVHTSPPLIRTVTWVGPSILDSDGDGLLDVEEDKNGNGVVDPGETDPFNPDTDGDGLMDGIELDDSDGNVTDPLNPDTDGDFLLDGVEDSNRNGRVDPGETDPNNWDTDGDGCSDKDDHFPLDPTKCRPDDGNDRDDAMMVLILAIVIAIVLGLTVYLVIIKTAGTRSVPEPRSGSGRPTGRSGDRRRTAPYKDRKERNDRNGRSYGPDRRDGPRSGIGRERRGG